MIMSLLKKYIISILVLSFSLLKVPMESYGGRIEKFGYAGSVYESEHGVFLDKPEGIAVSEAFFIVSDTGNGRLIRYGLKDHKPANMEKVIQVPQLKRPSKVVLDSGNVIYVLDEKQRRILRFTGDCEFIGYFDPAGVPSPPSYVTESFDIDKDGNVYVLDIRYWRVLVLASDGKYLKQLSLPEIDGFFSDIAITGKNDVLILDSTDAAIFRSQKGSNVFSRITADLKEHVRFPKSLVADRSGRMVVVDRNGGCIVILGRDGEFMGRHSGFGWKEGFLNYPSQLCIDSEGQIFVADTSNNRIQIFKMR